MSRPAFRLPVLLLVVTGLLAGAAAAAVPQFVNYQGTLADSQSQPLTGTYSLAFRIYATSSTPTVLWTETQPSVAVAGGVFHVILGSVTPLTPAVFSASERWLGISVNGGTEMTPRTRITAVPWALRAAIADSVVGGSGGGSDGDWTIVGSDMYSAVPGNVGIGATAPGKKLQIGQTSTPNSEGMIRLVSRSGTQGSNRVWDIGVPETDGDSGGIGYSFVIDDTQTGTSPEFMVKWGTGYVGIGTTTPDVPLDIYKPNGSTASSALRVATGYLVGSLPQAYYLDFNNNTINATRTSGDTSLRLNSTSGGNVYLAEGGGNVGIGVGTPGAKLDVAGTARVDVLEIMGADLAENFPMSETVEPGTVVSIDADRPGYLTPSREPYDRRLAGVISGANGLSVGALLGRCTPEASAEAVAMSGRVWALCDASDDAIEPGDLLTTSARAGHAMKATERSRSHGAVLGKAMSRLARGETGYVLVLVNLQ
jgi:type II secretory pathway pseudopilin PulG